MFIDAVEMMVAALKVTLDDVVVDVEFATATEDMALGYMNIAKGTVCGSRLVYAGVSNGKRVIELVMQWHLGNKMDKDWTDEGYVIEIKGEPDVRILYEVKEHSSTGYALPTAMHAVHAIPAVIGAKPGLVLVSDLPMIVAAHCVGAS